MEEAFKPLVRKIEYLDLGDYYKVFVRASERTDITLILDGISYDEISNKREPYDFCVHIFSVPKAPLTERGKFVLLFQQHGHRKSVFFSESVQRIRMETSFDPEAVIALPVANTRGERNLRFTKELDSGGDDAFRWKIEEYYTAQERRVVVYTMLCDPEYCTFVATTPFDRTEFVEKEIQTVVEQAQNEIDAGHTVLGAVNADFFDMFGNCAPSGLCVHKGKVVINGDSENQFFGVTKAGKPVIGTVDEIPVSTLKEAVGVGQRILKNGAFNDFAPLEPFGEVAHPRTGYGLTQDGKVLIMIIDGRRPEWSNGAALCEMARLMRDHGVVEAVNADGGGSSTFVINQEGSLNILNKPSDLEQPDADLIRPIYDALVIIKKKA